jgi:hypothetical protein
MGKFAVLLALLALVSMVAACGLTRVETVGGGPPSTLQCSQTNAGHGVDVVNMKVTCQVSGAASGDTSFQLHYTLKSGTGTLRSFDATCSGALQDGKGTCTQTYALVVPFDSGSPSISGEFLPSHKGLGPLPLPMQD